MGKFLRDWLWIPVGLFVLGVALVAIKTLPDGHNQPAAKKASSSIPKPMAAPSPVVIHSKTIPAGFYSGPGDGCEAKMLVGSNVGNVANASYAIMYGCTNKSLHGIIRYVSGVKYQAIFPKIKYHAECIRAFTFINGVIKLTKASQGCNGYRAAVRDYGTGMPHSYMEFIPSHNHRISKLPGAENALLTFMPRHVCNRNVSDIVDLLTGHGNLVGSGEYTGALHMFPGPHRSTLVFWTVRVRAWSPLSYSALQLVEIASGTLNSRPKPKFSGTTTLRFRITHNREFINFPELNSPTLTNFRQLELPSFSYSLKTEFRRCRARAQ